MIVTIQEARYITDYRIWLKFNTNEMGEVDLKDLIFHYSAAAPLQNIEQFKNFKLDSWPTLTWECGFVNSTPKRGHEQA